MHTSAKSAPTSFRGQHFLRRTHQHRRFVPSKANVQIALLSDTKEFRNRYKVTNSPLRRSHSNAPFALVGPMLPWYLCRCHSSFQIGQRRTRVYCHSWICLALSVSVSPLPVVLRDSGEQTPGQLRRRVHVREGSADQKTRVSPTFISCDSDGDLLES